MRIDDLYPLAFEHTAQGFRTLMRTLLIKANYDGVLKKTTGFRGMHVSEERQECWTLKFEQFAGVFGIFLANLDDTFGHFHLHYFPSPQEALLEKCSLAEACLANAPDFIDKVRTFYAHDALLAHFFIGTLALHVDPQNESFYGAYQGQMRERIYAKEGVVHPHEPHTLLVPKEGLDKDFPAFRLLLPLMHFFNTTLLRLTQEPPRTFELFRAKGTCLTYDSAGVFHSAADGGSVKILVATGYGKIPHSTLTQTLLEGTHAKKMDDSKSLTVFFQKAPWYELDANNHLVTTPLAQAVPKPKLIVVTGFLGSGKTSFLQHYIEHETQNNRFVGIIQNEIGKIGLDGKLLDYDYSLVEMDEGCVCCSLSGQLRAGIGALAQKASPDTILLETSGVANPFNLLSELDELDDLVDFEAIVTVVDGVNALALFEQYRIFQDQVRAADVILLNKSDLLDEITQAKVYARILANNRCAAILPVVEGNIHPSTLRHSIVASTSQIASLISEEESAPFTHVDEGISSLKVTLSTPLTKGLFSTYLRKLPKKIYRVKGVVRFVDEPNPWVVQYVNGQFEFLEQCNGANTETFLVFIGKDLDKGYFEGPL